MKTSYPSPFAKLFRKNFLYAGFPKKTKIHFQIVVFHRLETMIVTGEKPYTFIYNQCNFKGI